MPEKHIFLTSLALAASAIFLLAFEATRVVMRAQASLSSSQAPGSSSGGVAVAGLLPEDRLRIKVILATVLGGGIGVFLLSQLSNLAEHSVASMCLGFLMLIVALYISFVLPDSIFEMLRERRLEKMNRQLVDAMNVLALALRSGRTFESALPIVATQIPAPLSEEIERTVQEINVGGVSLDHALERLADRVPVKDMLIFVSTALIANSVGGSQAEILDKNSTLIRERFRIKQKIHSLTAEGRFSAFSIALAPMFILIVNYVIDSETVTMFVTNPIGMLILAAITVSDYVGYLILSKLVKIEF